MSTSVWVMMPPSKTKMMHSDVSRGCGRGRRRGGGPKGRRQLISSMSSRAAAAQGIRRPRPRRRGFPSSVCGTVPPAELGRWCCGTTRLRNNTPAGNPGHGLVDRHSARTRRVHVDTLPIRVAGGVRNRDGRSGDWRVVVHSDSLDRPAGTAHCWDVGRVRKVRRASPNSQWP